MSVLYPIGKRYKQQLDKLKKQAKQAEKYQELKKSEPLLRAHKRYVGMRLILLCRSNNSILRNKGLY